MTALPYRRGLGLQRLFGIRLRQVPGPTLYKGGPCIWLVLSYWLHPLQIPSLSWLSHQVGFLMVRWCWLGAVQPQVMG